MDKKYILLLKNSHTNQFYCLSKAIEDKESIYAFSDFESAKKEWNNCFKKLRQTRREFFERVFVIIYEPRIVVVDLEKLKNNVVDDMQIDNPYFTLDVNELFPDYAESLWNAGEPIDVTETLP